MAKYRGVRRRGRVMGKRAQKVRGKKHKKQAAAETDLQKTLQNHPEIGFVLGIATQVRRIGAFAIPMFIEESGEVTTTSAPGQVPAPQATA